VVIFFYLRKILASRKAEVIE